MTQDIPLFWKKVCKLKKCIDKVIRTLFQEVVNGRPSEIRLLSLQKAKSINNKNLLHRNVKFKKH